MPVTRSQIAKAIRLAFEAGTPTPILAITSDPFSGISDRMRAYMLRRADAVVAPRHGLLGEAIGEVTAGTRYAALIGTVLDPLTGLHHELRTAVVTAAAGDTADDVFRKIQLVVEEWERGSSRCRSGFRIVSPYFPLTR